MSMSQLDWRGGTDPHFSHWLGGGGGGGQLPLSQALYTLTTVALENQFKKMRSRLTEFIV